jgi:hypothetical protein
VYQLLKVYIVLQGLEFLKLGDNQREVILKKISCCVYQKVENVPFFSRCIKNVLVEIFWFGKPAGFI